MQNKDDKQRNSMSGSVDQSNDKKDDSSKYGSHHSERSYDREKVDQSSHRRDYDKNRSDSMPDDQSHRPQGGHSGNQQPEPQK